MDLAHPVFQLVAAGDVNALVELFNNDPQLVNRPDYDGNMPLHLAALSGSVECVRACLDALARRSDLDLETEINRKNFMNRDALSCAVISSSLEIVSILVEAGAKTDYRYSTEVIPLVEALNGPDIAITRYLLQVFDIDFQRSRMDQYWYAALQSDLTVTLGHFKLLRASAVPYGIGEFEEICLNMLEWNPKTKGLEDFLVYLCTDAVDRWSRQRDEIDKGLRRISSFFLRKLVPVTQSFSCVRRLQRLGVFEPPVSARAWLRVLSEWSLPSSKFPDHDIQDVLLTEFIRPSSASGNVCPIVVQSRGLIPLVLYFAVLALKFPHPDWLSHWNRLCGDAGFEDCCLSTLLELHTARHSRSASDFFWFEIFPFALSRAITTLEGFTMSQVYRELITMVDHVSLHNSALSPMHPASQSNVFFLNLLSCFPGSSPVPGHALFIDFVRDYVLPWVSEVNWDLLKTHSLVTATVHVLSHQQLLETVVDFNPSLAHYLVCNFNDWPHKAHSHLSFLSNCLQISYAESVFDSNPPRDLDKLVRKSREGNIPEALLRNWAEQRVKTPSSLSVLTKRCIRLQLRRCQMAHSPRQSLRELIDFLAIPQTMRDWLSSVY